MKLQTGHIEIFVKNPLAAKDFYINALGFEVEEVQGDKFVWLKNDTLILLLRPGYPQRQDTYQKTNIAFVIYTDNLEEAKQHFNAKGVQFKGTDGSEDCLTFTDDDGNWFQLVENL